MGWIVKINHYTYFRIMHFFGCADNSYAKPVARHVLNFAYQQTRTQSRSGDYDFDEYADEIWNREGWNQADTRQLALDQFRQLKVWA